MILGWLWIGMGGAWVGVLVGDPSHMFNFVWAILFVLWMPIHGTHGGDFGHDMFQNV